MQQGAVYGEQRRPRIWGIKNEQKYSPLVDSRQLHTASDEKSCASIAPEGWHVRKTVTAVASVTPVAACMAALLMLAASPTFATERYHQSTLKFVYPISNGDFVIGFDSDPSTCSSASAPKYFYVLVGQNGVTAAGSLKLFAAAMTALVTRQTVAAAFDDATSNCYVNRFSVQD